ncbi:MAG: hypothetical protein AAB783_00130 [Patescibacteria group bacterium]
MNKIFSLVLGMIAGAGLFFFGALIFFVLPFGSIIDLSYFSWLFIIIMGVFGFILPLSAMLYFRKKSPYFAIGVFVGAALFVVWGVRNLYTSTYGDHNSLPVKEMNLPL